MPSWRPPEPPCSFAIIATRRDAATSVACGSSSASRSNSSSSAASRPSADNVSPACCRKVGGDDWTAAQAERESLEHRVRPTGRTRAYGAGTRLRMCFVCRLASAHSAHCGEVAALRGFGASDGGSDALPIREELELDSSCPSRAAPTILSTSRRHESSARCCRSSVPFLCGSGRNRSYVSSYLPIQSSYSPPPEGKNSHRCQKCVPHYKTLPGANHAYQ